MKIKPWDATNRPVHRSARRSALSTSYLTRPKGRFTSSTTKQRLRRLQARRCASSVPWKTICSRLQASTLVRQSKRPASRPTLYAGGSALSTCVPWLVKALSRKSNLLEARKERGGEVRKFILGIIATLMVLGLGGLAVANLGLMPTNADATPPRLARRVAA